MVSTSTKFALNKRTQDRKPISTRWNEAFNKKSISTKRKNCLHCQELETSQEIGLHLISRMAFSSRKNLRMKAQGLELTRKFISISQNERLVEKYGFTRPGNCFHSNQCLKKLKQMVSTSRNKTFLKYWPPSNCNNGFKNNI